ncbi:hypothetical protein QBC33DRAFT_532330 [Phialemonium atrogriseum]|uniref:Uncharacterized protein n=1 Tax=Phialemonium atrogriseum TaxID=1093897 RepID=A0AAJ0FI00_9PEZI|nr:uncharacterized protein QBC33DRAFT_532330 [Phialemonium atrogriseum]KAK1769121.1 hypothetical protein QBC33DRAFT_532330 [Phialemonium atrogriseum]
MASIYDQDDADPSHNLIAESTMAIPQVKTTPQMPPLWQPPQESQPTAYQPYGIWDPPPSQHAQVPPPTVYQPYGTPSQHAQVPSPTVYQSHGTWHLPDQQQTLVNMQQQTLVTMEQMLAGMQQRLELLEASISTLNLENSALNPDPIFGGSDAVLKRLQRVWDDGGEMLGFPVTPTQISLMSDTRTNQVLEEIGFLRELTPEDGDARKKILRRMWLGTW